jgi:hypothetical protein
MRKSAYILLSSALLLTLGMARVASAQRPLFSALPPSPSAERGGQAVDGIAARIEDDVITESEVNELASFQKLVDGHSKPRAELINELADQWIVRGEADEAKYPQPSQESVDAAYTQLEQQFSSPVDFKQHCAEAGIGEIAIRRMLTQQLYLAHFLDYRFRPAAQVDQQQVESFYEMELVPQLKAKGQPVPRLEDVQGTIREVLIQRAITERSTQWLDETRANLKIDVMQPAGQP